MSSVYPGGLDSLSTSHADGVNEKIHAADVNNLADAVNKIEAELGVDPKGTHADVAAALVAKQADMGVVLDTDGTLAANSDTRVPSQKAVKTAIANSGSLTYVKTYGAKCDGRRLTGNMTSGSAVFTAASGTFTAADVGKVVAVGDNSGTGVVMAATGTILSVDSTTQATLSVSAPHALTAVSLDVGTDDTVAVQAAIEAVTAAGGGKVVFPDADCLVSSVTLKAGVELTTLSANQGYAPQRVGPGRLRSVTAGAVIVDTPAGNTYGPAITGFQLDGHGVASIGVRMQSPQWGGSRSLSFTNFTDQGLLVAGGNTHVVQNVLAVNCLLTRTRAAVAGAVEIRGADHRVDDVEATASLSALSDANAYLKGIVIAQSNGYHNGLMGETSDGGIYVSGNYNRFANCRADLNWGHGWEIAGANNTFASCHGVGCGAQTANTYDHFKVSGTGNSFAACRSKHTSGHTVKYGFEDTVAQGPVAARNTYDASCGGDGATAPFLSQPYVGSGRALPPHDVHPADTTTQIDVTGTSLIILDLYATPTSVTDFLGGVQGQSVAVYGNANVTIKNNTGAAGTKIKTNTAADKVLVAARFYRFTLFNGTWYEDA